MNWEISYNPYYRKWLKDVLSRCKPLLIASQLYNVVFASLFTYDYDDNRSHKGILWELGVRKQIPFIPMWWRFRSHHGTYVHIFGGLPCIGTFYDEVVHSAKELQEVDGYGQPYLPRSCYYLFMVYHRLQGRMKGQWKVNEWVIFCFRGDPIYPTPRKQAKKTNLPKHIAKTHLVW